MKIKREILKDINKWIGDPKVLVLKGARQVGKTTILKHIESSLKLQGKKTIYYSIDFELGNPLFQNSKLFVQFIQEQYSDDFIYIFLDEFQYINNAGMFIKNAFDCLRDKCQLIVSGSSSLEISKNSEFLTGRKIDFKINTLSFHEFLSYKSKFNYNKKLNLMDFNEIERFDQIYRDDIKKYFLEYINIGGYPEVALNNDIDKKKLILKEIVSTYIQKDVSGFLKIDNISGFNTLLKVLTSQIGALVNKNELCNTLNLGHDTVRKYLEILSGTYILHFLFPYFSNVRKELSKMQKVYITDFGLEKIISNRRSFLRYEDISGNIIENYIYLEFLNKVDEVKFYRTASKSEIDFIIFNESNCIPVEVKFQNSVNSRKVPIPIKNFKNKYQNIDFTVVVTKNTLFFNEGNNCYFIPAYLLAFISF